MCGCVSQLRESDLPLDEGNLSSHILSEVQQIADHVGIIAGGVLGYESQLHAGEDLEKLFMEVVREYSKEV